MRSQKSKQALIAGSSGLIGHFLLGLLLESPTYDRVIALVRTPTGKLHPKLEERSIDFDRLEMEISDVEVNDVFICLGSTMKKAKTREKFRKIDLEYPWTIAQKLRQNGAERLAVVSALGANSKSRFFYNRVKGQLENKLKELDYEGLFIFQPSLLMGHRQEFRLGEVIGQKTMCVINPLMVGPLKAYRSIHAFDVALAMLNVCKESLKGQFKIASEQIKVIAREAK